MDVRAGDEIISVVWLELDLGDELAVTRDSVQRAFGTNIPHTCGVVARAGTHVKADRTEGCGQHLFGVALQYESHLAGAHVPQETVSSQVTGSDQRAVRVERKAIYSSAMPRLGQHTLLMLQIPQAPRAVV